MSKSTAKRPSSSTRKKTSALPKQVAAAVRAAASKQASDIVVLDLRDASAFTDFFVICTGANARQIRAIADAVEETLLAERVKPALVEGYQRSEWILLDYFDFVVHVFSPELRGFYALDRLWGGASHVDIRAIAGESAAER